MSIQANTIYENNFNFISRAPAWCLKLQNIPWCYTTESQCFHNHSVFLSLGLSVLFFFYTGKWSGLLYSCTWKPTCNAINVWNQSENTFCYIPAKWPTAKILRYSPTYPVNLANFSTAPVWNTQHKSRMLLQESMTSDDGGYFLIKYGGKASHRLLNRSVNSRELKKRAEVRNTSFSLQNI